MKKYIGLSLIVILLIGVSLFIWQQKNISFFDQNVYVVEGSELKFKLPLGWTAKPYPLNNELNTMIFINDKDFDFPDAWGGPLTPIILTILKDQKIEEGSHKALVENEPDLQVENFLFKKYPAIKIKGSPVNDYYFKGTYYESLSIQRGTDAIHLYYYDGNPQSLKYVKEYNFIIESLEI